MKTALPCALALAAAPALAQREAPVVSVADVSSTCPDAASVARELAKLLPRHRVEIAARAALSVRVSDLGDRYRVLARGVDRVVADAGRRCAERARAAAVMAALAIAPPWLDEDRAAPRATPPRSGWQVALEVGPLADSAPFSDTGAEPTVGFAVRAAAGGARVQLAGGAAVLAPATVELGAVSARVLRVPLDVGIRLLAGGERFQLLTELGVVATVLRVEGRNFAEPRTDTRLDLGLRAALLFRHWPGDRLGWFAGPLASVSPRAYDLFADTLGVVGRTPRFRLGAVLGVALRLE